jgi:hypothetical protein
MRRRTASLSLALAVALGGVGAVSAQIPSEGPPSGATPSEAAMTALLTVCKPAAERQLTLDVVADQAGYAREAAPPAGLTIMREGARSWKVPSVSGVVHLVAGEVPEPAQASACMVAVYGDPMDGFEALISRRLTAPDLGFERDPQQSFTTGQYHVDHYTAQQGYLSRNILVIRPVAPSLDHPTLSVIAYRVDYSWLKSISH